MIVEALVFLAAMIAFWIWIDRIGDLLAGLVIRWLERW